MPRITVYSDGVLIADSGAVVETPVTTPVVWPPNIPPAIMPPSVSVSNRPELLVNAPSVSIGVGPGQMRIFKFKVDPAKRNLEIHAPTNNSQQAIHIMLSEDVTDGIVSTYNTLLTRAKTSSFWGRMTETVAPRAWANFSFVGSEDIMLGANTFDTRGRSEFYLLIANDSAGTSHSNVNIQNY